jgi:ABC-type sugar transport system substrate-binding protein
MGGVERTVHKVPALARAARVLDALGVSGAPLTLAQLTERLGAPKASVLGICRALAEERLLARGTDGSYALGPRAFELCSLARTEFPSVRAVGFTYPENQAFFLAECAQLVDYAQTHGIAVDARCAERSLDAQTDHIEKFIAAGVDLILVEAVTSHGLEAGFLDIVAGYPALSVSARARGALDQESGQQAAREILNSGASIDGVFAVNDQIALGVSKEFADAGKAVPIVSVDGVRETAEQILAGGPIIGTAAQDPRHLMSLALEIGIALSSSPGTAQNTVFLPPRLIDATTAKGYEPWG